jgi:phage terminase small subunit
MARTRKLTDKQLAFIREYPKDWNATQAAIRAGYNANSAAVTANELLQNPLIKPKIENKIEVLDKKADGVVQKILEELMRIAFFDIRDVLSWTDTGVAFIDSTKINENAARAISEIKETANNFGGSRSIKMHDKIRALELLGRYAGMFKEQVEVTNKTSHEVIIEQIESEKKLIGGG